MTADQSFFAGTFLRLHRSQSMKIIEQYRRNAEEALQAARDTQEPLVKQAWLAIADEWLALAEARRAILAGTKPSDH